MTVAPTQQNLYAVLQPFIATVLGISPNLVIQGLPNRAAMPLAAPGFVTMTNVRMRRLRTNIDSWDQTTPTPTEIASEQGVEVRAQIDFYGPTAGDWAVEFTTLFRDDYGCTQLAGADPENPVCQPLYTNDPILSPLDDSEDQYEQRWTVEAVLQYNPVTTVPMTFADSLEVTLINVDEAYPP